MDQRGDGTGRRDVGNDASAASWIGLLSRGDLTRVDAVAQAWAGRRVTGPELRVITEGALADAAATFDDTAGTEFFVYALSVLRRHLRRAERLDRVPRPRRR
jgi:hypothetical protein